MANTENVLAAGFASLRRFTQRTGQTAEAIPRPEQCEFCSEPIPPQHRHLLEVSTRELKCACHACSILFDKETASLGKYRLIPNRRLHLADFQMSDIQWATLRLPVEMVFFFASTPADRVVAFYPSPMGPTESLLKVGAWEALVASNPALKTMAPDVEALLINRTHGAREHFLVPVDDCYRLVGLLRRHWRGLSGGTEVWQAIEHFFEELLRRSQAVYRELP